MSLHTDRSRGNQVLVLLTLLLSLRGPSLSSRTDSHILGFDKRSQRRRGSPRQKRSAPSPKQIASGSARLPVAFVQTPNRALQIVGPYQGQTEDLGFLIIYESYIADLLTPMVRIHVLWVYKTVLTVAQFWTPQKGPLEVIFAAEL